MHLIKLKKKKTKKKIQNQNWKLHVFIHFRFTWNRFCWQHFGTIHWEVCCGRTSRWAKVTRPFGLNTVCHRSCENSNMIIFCGKLCWTISIIEYGECWFKCIVVRFRFLHETKNYGLCHCNKSNAIAMKLWPFGEFSIGIPKHKTCHTNHMHFWCCICSVAPEIVSRNAFDARYLGGKNQNLCHLIYGANSFACFIAIFNDHCSSSSVVYCFVQSQWNLDENQMKWNQMKTST